ncbi:DUF1815 family protein, partial [Nostoc sp. UCD122]|nr:DUF1815 family protein [Nostoc sp. UCD122]
MPDSEDPNQVSSSDLRNTQFGGGLINADTVNTRQIGGDIYNIHLGQQTTASGNSVQSQSQTERSQHQRDLLEKAYTLQSQKVAKIRTALVIETDASRKFQYEHQLREEECTLKELGDKLDAVETQSLYSIATEKCSNKYYQARVVLSAKLTSDNKAQFKDKKIEIEAIVAHLGKILGDVSLTILDIEEGSIVIKLGGSPEDIERLVALFKSGELTEILGINVEDIQLSKSDDINENVEPYKNLSNDQKSSEFKNVVKPVEHEIDIFGSVKQYRQFIQDIILNLQALAIILERQGYAASCYVPSDDVNAASFMVSLSDNHLIRFLVSNYGITWTEMQDDREL